MPEKNAIKQAVKEALAETIGPLYVDRETHFKHHQFINDVISMLDDTKGTVRRVLIHAFIWGALALILLGVILFGRQNFNG